MTEPPAPSGKYIFGPAVAEKHTARQATGCVAVVWGVCGLGVGAYIGWKLSAHHQLSTALRAVLTAASALVLGGGAALISGLVAGRGTEDKRVAQLRAEYGVGESDSDPQGDAER
ncbi:MULTISPECIES: hypothetical protein [Streptomyces violaceusniger group]|uniref:Uncharacterized protein n=1 Tax=Streptomyces melanosporofaciens TaxID=67327 RepID=A0A1H4QMU8_STRMJ|nr:MULTISPECIES: hypothetical protein [Streptomyces violaceusniger group]SEC20884.1 hypothetical protein SAMN04490356_3302 [Streptomyces melanosporofaciens]